MLLVAACGGTEAAETVDTGVLEPAAAGMDGDGETTGEPDGMGDGHDHGAHGSLREITDGVAAPTIAIEITEDPVEGWNLRLLTTDFRMAPERVSTAHVDGEGHAHLYIDGVRVSRVYGQWHHIGALAAGDHEVRVELSSNDHSTLAVGGDKIDATTSLRAHELGDQAMGEGQAGARPASEPHPSLSLTIVDDPAGGWNINAVPSNFRLAAENASRQHADGEGYMRLLINGESVARIYETWHQMPPLPAGTHEIRVELRSNDHAPITVDGVAVGAVATLEVSESEASAAVGRSGEGSGHHHGDHSDGGEGSHVGENHQGDHSHGGEGHHHGSAGEPTRHDADIADADQTIVVEVVGGDPVGGSRRVEVELGSVVALLVTSDTAEEVHVHGYDILRAVSPGSPAHFAFTAAIPGVLEVELERSGRLLLQLQVS